MIGICAPGCSAATRIRRALAYPGVIRSQMVFLLPPDASMMFRNVYNSAERDTDATCTSASIGSCILNLASTQSATFRLRFRLVADMVFFLTQQTRLRVAYPSVRRDPPLIIQICLPVAELLRIWPPRCK